MNNHQLKGESTQAKHVACRLQEKIQTGSLDLPLLPGVAADVLRLVESHDSDAQSLSKLIQSDPALASHVMRIANSALYSPNSTLVSLQQAIARLGMTMISEIAFAASVNAKTFSAPGYEKLVEKIWRHSLASALWAKEIARKARKNVETTFLCGLLHQIGKPVVMQALSDIMAEDNIVLTEEEVIVVVDEYQQLVGANVAAHWKLPESVIETINYTEDYFAAPSISELVMIVCGGNRFATFMLDKKTKGEAELNEFKALPVMSDLNLYEDEIESLLDKTDVIKSAVEALSM